MAPDALRALCETVKNEAETIVCVLAAVQTEKGSVNFALPALRALYRAGGACGQSGARGGEGGGGSGGGKPDAAMAGGKDASKVEAALGSRVQHACRHAEGLIAFP